MASPFGRAPTVTSPEHRPATKGTVIFSYTCVGLTGAVVISVLIIFCQYRVRGRAPVTAAGPGSNPDDGHVSVDIAKLPELSYTESARRSGGDAAQCSVCLGTVQVGEMVRRLPMCKHLYHVECIDMWLASHTTCPLCRADVEPKQGDEGQAAPAEPPLVLPE
ncbi:RING-H2 finger protein ATL39-like [Phragmites australis]|uniref:RING-H2 finger protein ATL39-like n=1 Tax=Phragmites australis TaxID=29695 RepID=UPI002D7A2725|nr:RING-H2 finger protein ATL39-like [Phragmites australis]